MAVGIGFLDCAVAGLLGQWSLDCVVSRLLTGSLSVWLCKKRKNAVGPFFKYRDM